MTKVPEDCREGFYRLTLLRVAISSAIVSLSVCDRALAAKGNSELSSTRMCRWYIAARDSIVLRNVAASFSDKIP